VTLAPPQRGETEGGQLELQWPNVSLAQAQVVGKVGSTQTMLRQGDVDPVSLTRLLLFDRLPQGKEAPAERLETLHPPVGHGIHPDHYVPVPVAMTNSAAASEPCFGGRDLAAAGDWPAMLRPSEARRCRRRVRCSAVPWTCFSMLPPMDT